MSEDIMRYSLLAYVLSMRNLSAVRRYYAIQPTGLCAQYEESECGFKRL